ADVATAQARTSLNQRATPRDRLRTPGESQRIGSPAMETQPDTEPSRTRVALIFGGRSEEHAISCATAASVMRAIDRDRYDVVPIGITRDGHWVQVADDPAPLEISQG